MTCTTCTMRVMVVPVSRPNQRSRNASKVPGPIEAKIKLEHAHVMTIKPKQPVSRYNPIGFWRRAAGTIRRGLGGVSSDRSGGVGKAGCEDQGELFIAR